jgi:hypothetical protein
LAKEAVSLLEDRFSDRLNENNGYEGECLVLPNGRLVNLGVEYESSFELFREAEQVPQDKRHEWARLVALQCVAMDLQVGGQCHLLVDPSQLRPMAYWDDFESLMKQIMLEVPARLARAMGERADAAADCRCRRLSVRTLLARRLGAEDATAS